MRRGPASEDEQVDGAGDVEARLRTGRVRHRALSSRGVGSGGLGVGDDRLEGEHGHGGVGAGGRHVQHEDVGRRAHDALLGGLLAGERAVERVRDRQRRAVERQGRRRERGQAADDDRAAVKRAQADHRLVVGRVRLAVRARSLDRLVVAVAQVVDLVARRVGREGVVVLRLRVLGQHVRVLGDRVLRAHHERVRVRRHHGAADLGLPPSAASGCSAAGATSPTAWAGPRRSARVVLAQDEDALGLEVRRLVGHDELRAGPRLRARHDRGLSGRRQCRRLAACPSVALARTYSAERMSMAGCSTRGLSSEASSFLSAAASTTRGRRARATTDRA